MILGKRLGEILISSGFVTKQQLDKALKKQRNIIKENTSSDKASSDSLISYVRFTTNTGRSPLLGRILLDLGYISQFKLDEALEKQDKSIEIYKSLDSGKLGIAIEMGSLVYSSHNLAEVLCLVMENVNRVTDSIASTLMLFDEETGELVFSVPTGPKAELLKDVRLSPGEGIAGWVAKHGEPALVPNAQEDLRFYSGIDAASGLETKSLICVPLKSKTKLIGVLEVMNKRDGTFFTEEDVLVLSVFAHQAALAIENARLHGKLEARLKQQQQTEKKFQQAQKMEAIGTLAGGVAHDLNNILGALVSYPELLLLQLPEDSSLRKPILMIQKSGEKVAAIVQDLLTLARRGVNTIEVVNLNSVVSDYLESPEHEKLQSNHPGVHVNAHLEKEALNIPGSSIHLFKTVMNLASNAAEAMPKGGALTISTENRYLDTPISGYDAVKKGDFAVLTISDTGTGISPDSIGKIFEPFYTKKKMGRSGTGLGMAVVWGTVKDHNGYIDVQSAEGRGSTFTLYFPVTREKLSEDQTPLSIESYNGNGESLLIVDDVEEQRKIASGMLEELKYSVVSVSSGEEAVKYLKTNKVDLLILDMIMDPGMDGLDTYKKILETHPGQKAIIASGFSETDRVKEALNLGAGTYIKKPFLLEKIGLAVKEELEKSDRPGPGPTT